MNPKNLNAHRPWITPLVMGAFTLSGVTGVLMFFHLDTGLNKAAHEWLSWVLVVGVVLHILLNVGAFKRYFTQTKARWVMGVCAAALALSFVPLTGEKSLPPFATPVQALANAPLPTLAAVAGIELPELDRRLQAAHLPVPASGQTVGSLVGPDLKAQMRALNAVLKPTAQ